MGMPEGGEYRVLHSAHWQDGTHDLYRSMRHWIATMTRKMERDLELSEMEMDEEDSET
jgi:hypothetical protein